MSYLRSFIPWLVFVAVSTADWRWGAAAALVSAGSQVLQGRRTGSPADLLTVSTAVYFAALTAVAFADPGSSVHPWTAALSLGWLALTAWASLAIGRPFTLVIAKRTVPSELWEHPLFRRVNVVITAVWASSFTVTAAALAGLREAGAPTGVAIAVQVAGFAIPAVFTARYPAYARAKARSGNPAA